MKDIMCGVKLLITRLLTDKLPLLPVIFILMMSMPSVLEAQAAVPPTAIMELKDGYLLVRIPTYKAKIDTLTAMTHRAKDPKDKAQLEKQLQEAISKRDTLLSDYVNAFKLNYHFSQVAYFFDYDARDLNKASYYNMDSERIPMNDLIGQKIFYLYFERTPESKMDALVIHDRFGGRIPNPFPNNFTLGGINTIFLKISDKKLPMWRIRKMDKAFFKYYAAVKLETSS
jgi:hypothetical protein